MRVKEPIKLRYQKLLEILLMLTYFGAINFGVILFIVECSFAREIVMRFLMSRKSASNRIIPSTETKLG